MGGSSSNIPPRYILRPRILCISAQYLGSIEEGRGSNSHCKFSKESYGIQNLINVAPYTALIYSTWRWDSSWGSSGAGEVLLRALRPGKSGFREPQRRCMNYHPEYVPDYLMTTPADMDRWECGLRYHHCPVHDLLCEFDSFPPSCFTEK